MEITSKAFYDIILEPHRRALRKMELEFEFFQSAEGQIDVYAVQGRLKSWQSATQKAQRLGIPVEELQDLAGIRIIVGTQDDIPVVERFFTTQQELRDVEIKKSEEVKKGDGYRARHLVVEVKEHYQRSVFPGRVEVQIQTVFGHAFNFLSHSWIYKQDWQLSAEWEKRFAQLSKTLAQIEQDATDLHARLIHAIAHEESSALSPYSLRLLVKQEFDEDIPLEYAIDSCRYYSEIGYRTNGQLRNFFRDVEVTKLYEEVTAVSTDQEGQDQSNVQLLGKAGFWRLFGTKLEAARDFFSAKARAKNKSQ